MLVLQARVLSGLRVIREMSKLRITRRLDTPNVKMITACEPLPNLLSTLDL
jgi:hypothetical protein